MIKVDANCIKTIFTLFTSSAGGCGATVDWYPPLKFLLLNKSSSESTLFKNYKAYYSFTDDNYPVIMFVLNCPDMDWAAFSGQVGISASWLKVLYVTCVHCMMPVESLEGPGEPAAETRKLLVFRSSAVCVCGAAFSAASPAKPWPSYLPRSLISTELMANFQSRLFSSSG